jgi:hypothetical protein
MRDRRGIALVALFAMAFAGLLPFLASARMLVADGPVEHCHRLSIDAMLDPDPAAPEGPSQPRKATCPFCASAVVAPPSSPPPLPGFVAIGFVAARAALPASRRTGAPVPLPPSRAPPDLSR